LIAIVSGLLIVLGVGIAVLAVRDYWTHKEDFTHVPWIRCGLMGFILNGLNVLGIGSFATITAGLRLFKQTEDKLIPGTLNVSCTIPVIVQAIIFIKVIEVEPITLVAMFAAASIGSYFGARIVVKLPEQHIRIAVSIALFVAAFFMLASQIHWLPSGGDALGLRGAKLVIAILGNGIFGALMTAGIGLYAPCMALVCFLGMSPAVAFPIMMGSCAFLLPISSVKFIRTGTYDRKTALVLQLSGVAGILFAVYIVISLPMEILRWIIIVVLLYTSAMMFMRFHKEQKNRERQQ
jgi:uncharacterized membrane protein YfcA